MFIFLTLRHTEIKCELRTAPSNGEVTCSDSNQFESSCVYECLPGYELIGEANSTCLDNEKWSSDLPQCISKYRHYNIDSILTIWS